MSRTEYKRVGDILEVSRGGRRYIFKSISEARLMLGVGVISERVQRWFNGEFLGGAKMPCKREKKKRGK